MWHQIESHEKECLFPQKTGTDLLESVTTLASEASEEVERLTGMLKMFSYEKIAICGRVSFSLIQLITQFIPTKFPIFLSNESLKREV